MSWPRCPCAPSLVCSCSAGSTSRADGGWLSRTCQSYPPRKAGRFTGKDFSLQPDGSLRCPAGKSLWCGEQRREADGSLRLVFEARIADCRSCSLRQQCQWHGHQAKHPRRVSLRLASPSGRLCTAALARLATPGASTRLHAASALGAASKYTFHLPRRGLPLPCLWSSRGHSGPIIDFPMTSVSLATPALRISRRSCSPCSVSRTTLLLSSDYEQRKHLCDL